MNILTVKSWFSNEHDASFSASWCFKVSLLENYQLEKIRMSDYYLQCISCYVHSSSWGYKEFERQKQNAHRTREEKTALLFILKQ